MGSCYRYGSSTEVDARYKALLKKFHRQHPYYADLSEIEIRGMENRDTFVGNGPVDIKPRNADTLIKKDLAYVIDSSYGEEIHLTKKGERYLNKTHRLLEDMLDQVSEPFK